MKCSNCGYDAEASIDKCIKCEELFESEQRISDRSELTMIPHILDGLKEKWEEEVSCLDPDNINEFYSEIERIKGEIIDLLTKMIVWYAEEGEAE
jgi:hypothetical protein